MSENTEIKIRDLEAKLKNLEERNLVLADIEAIKNLKSMYFYLADTAIRSGDVSKWDDLMNHFTEDATCEWTGLGRYEGKEACTGFFRGFNDMASFSIHTGHNAIVKVDGDKAKGNWYLHVSLTMKKENLATWIAGYYEDVFQKVNGLWKFKEIKGEFYYWTPFEDGWVKRQFMF